jgi:hypothetical protein
MLHKLKTLKDRLDREQLKLSKRCFFGCGSGCHTHFTEKGIKTCPGMSFNKEEYRPVWLPVLKWVERVNFFREVDLDDKYLVMAKVFDVLNIPYKVGGYDANCDVAYLRDTLEEILAVGGNDHFRVYPEMSNPKNVELLEKVRQYAESLDWEYPKELHSYNGKKYTYLTGDDN